MDNQTKETFKNILGWVAFTTLIVFIFYFMMQLEPERHNYEVRGADGTIYHTTRIGHGTNRIWFRDENGNSIELGGGYTVIEK